MDVRSVFDEFHPIAVEFREILRRTVPKMRAGFHVPSKERGTFGQCRSRLRYDFVYLDKKELVFVDEIPSLDHIQRLIVAEDYSQTERYAKFIKPAEDIVDTWLEKITKAHVSDEKRRKSSPPSKSARLDALKIAEALKSTCKRIVTSENVTDADSAAYSDLRARLQYSYPAFLPDALAHHATASSFKGVALSATNTVLQAVDEIDLQFRATFESALEADDPSPKAEQRSRRSSGPRDRRTIAQRIVVIRRFAPVALEAIDGLVELHRLRLDNQIPEPEDLKALDLLRALHAEIGALIRAIDEGKPFAAKAARIARLRDRLFGFAGETGELLIGGAPAITAAVSTSLTAIMALHFLCGIETDSTGAAAALTVTGGVFGGLSIAKAAKAKRK